MWSILSLPFVATNSTFTFVIQVLRLLGNVFSSKRLPRFKYLLLTSTPPQYKDMWSSFSGTPQMLLLCFPKLALDGGSQKMQCPDTSKYWLTNRTNHVDKILTIMEIKWSIGHFPAVSGCNFLPKIWPFLYPLANQISTGQCKRSNWSRGKQIPQGSYGHDWGLILDLEEASRKLMLT